MLFGKYLNKYYKKYWPLLLLGVLVLIVVDVAQTFIPKFLGQIVDNDNKLVNDLGELWRIVGYVLLCAGIMFVGRFVWRIAIFRASTGIAAGLRKDMFEKAEKLTPAYYHEVKVGNILNYFTSDIDEISEFFGWGTVMIVDAVFLSASVVVSMLRVNIWLTALLAIPLTLIIIWGLLGDSFFSKRWESRQKEFDRLYDFAQENFAGIRVIKSFVKQTKETFAFSKIALSNKEVNVKFARLSVLFDMFIEIILIAALSLLLAFGGWMVYSCATGNPLTIFGKDIRITVGELIEFTGYMELIIWPMIALGSIISMHSRAKGSLKRISGFLATPLDVVNPENAHVLKDVNGEIEFRDFSFTYPDGDKPVLRHVSLVIKPGEHIGIVGKVGSGKTAFVNALFRLYNVAEGQLFIDGHDIMDCDITSVRDAIAYAPQDNFLFSDTVENNIAFSAEKPDHEKTVEAAEFADVKDNIEGFTKGYETVSGERGVTLSGGQKQRISIARAYYKDAPVLVLDDCVSAVDVKTEEKILKNIKQKRAGRTTILIASRVSSVAQMDRILVIDKGEAVAFGTQAELLKTCPIFARMTYLQQLEREVEGGERHG